jgi:hypothetical protein
MSDQEPISIAEHRKPAPPEPAAPAEKRVQFDRSELNLILNVYGRMVAAGEWRDYAIDALRDRAVFSIFRRTSEMPLYRVEKDPALARRQGAYSVVTPTGLILKRGHDLARVLQAIDRRLRLV